MSRAERQRFLAATAAIRQAYNQLSVTQADVRESEIGNLIVILELAVHEEAPRTAQRLVDMIRRLVPLRLRDRFEHELTEAAPSAR